MHVKTLKEALGYTKKSYHCQEFFVVSPLTVMAPFHLVSPVELEATHVYIPESVS